MQDKPRHELPRICCCSLGLPSVDSIENLVCEAYDLAVQERLELERSMRNLTTGDGRAGNNLSFNGRLVKQQKFCIVSFPGRYEDEWIKMTEGEAEMVAHGLMEKEQQIATTCVFYPDESAALYGLHSNDAQGKCHCTGLYGELPIAATWPDRKAPWGCMWMSQWIMNTKAAVHEMHQTPVVVFFEGQKGNRQEGLGQSQQGEVRYLTEVLEAEPVTWDVKELDQLAQMARDFEAPARA